MHELTEFTIIMQCCVSVSLCTQDRSGSTTMVVNTEQLESQSKASNELDVSELLVRLKNMTYQINYSLSFVHTCRMEAVLLYQLHRIQ